jgi:hypothetical protein
LATPPEIDALWRRIRGHKQIESLATELLDLERIPFRLTVS